jgi:hypothetical protein
MSACLSADRNDQAQLGFIELSSMIMTNLFRILDFVIGICLLFACLPARQGICYLALIVYPKKRCR